MIILLQFFAILFPLTCQEIGKNDKNKRKYKTNVLENRRFVAHFHSTQPHC